MKRKKHHPFAFNSQEFYAYDNATFLHFSLNVAEVLRLPGHKHIFYPKTVHAKFTSLNAATQEVCISFPHIYRHCTMKKKIIQEH